MQKRTYHILEAILVTIGLLLIIAESHHATAAVIGRYIDPTTITTTGIVIFLFGVVLFLSLEKHFLTYVKGKNPATKQERQSPLYARVTAENVDEIFQTDLTKLFGQGIAGAKGIVYQDYSGKYHVAFLTEAIDTHHRHAAATVARLKDGMGLDDPSFLNARADALYEGDSEKSCELLTKCAGFELQYDKNKKKIIGIKQDSWLTKEQRRCGRYLAGVVEEDMITELIAAIDIEYLPKNIEALEDEAIKKIKRPK
jgi:hypothetical protein